MIQEIKQLLEDVQKLFTTITKQSESIKETPFVSNPNESSKKKKQMK